jgi:hypothetical protein
VLGDRVINRQYALAKPGWEIVGEPGANAVRRRPIVHQGNAAPKFSDRSDADENPVLIDGVQPSEPLFAGRRRLPLRQHIGIE